jgi:hypothetical protein
MPLSIVSRIQHFSLGIKNCTPKSFNPSTGLFRKASLAGVLFLIGSLLFLGIISCGRTRTIESRLSAFGPNSGEFCGKFDLMCRYVKSSPSTVEGFHAEIEPNEDEDADVVGKEPRGGEVSFQEHLEP